MDDIIKQTHGGNRVIFRWHVLLICGGPAQHPLSWFLALHPVFGLLKQGAIYLFI